MVRTVPAIHCLHGYGSETRWVDLPAGLWAAHLSFSSYRPYVWRKEILFDLWDVEHGEELYRTVPPSYLDIFVELVSEAGGSVLLAERVTPEPNFSERLWLLTSGAIDLQGEASKDLSGPWGGFLYRNVSENTHAFGFVYQKVFRTGEEMKPGRMALMVETSREWEIILYNQPLDEYPDPPCPEFEDES